MLLRKICSLIITSCLVCPAVGCGDNSEGANPDAGSTETINWSNDNLCTSECMQDDDCNAYLQCVTGGRVGCMNGHCTGFNNVTSNFDCIHDMPANCPSAGSVCGWVEAPKECDQYDPADDRCHFAEGLRPGEDQYRAWLQVTSNVYGATVTVHSLSAYCVHDDGTLTVASGTAAGGLTIEWCQWNYRDTWYQAGKGHGLNEIYKTVYEPGKTTYDVPQYPYLLHLGNNGGLTDGCREIVLKAEVSTTGDAKVELGLDYYTGYSWSHESGVSGWKSCTSGTAILLTPRSDHQVCEGDLTVSTSPPPSNGCPATGIKVAPGSALLNPCPTLITETWGEGGKTYQSAPGQPLTINDSWQGYAYVDTVCNGKEHDSWPQVTCQQAGFAQICVQGQDLTAQTCITWDPYSKKYRPTVPLMSGMAPCP